MIEATFLDSEADRQRREETTLSLTDLVVLNCLRMPLLVNMTLYVYTSVLLSPRSCSCLCRQPARLSARLSYRPPILYARLASHGY
jgi:hypothetical protein